MHLYLKTETVKPDGNFQISLGLVVRIAYIKGLGVWFLPEPLLFLSSEDNQNPQKIQLVCFGSNGCFESKVPILSRMSF